MYPLSVVSAAKVQQILKKFHLNFPRWEEAILHLGSLARKWSKKLTIVQHHNLGLSLTVVPQDLLLAFMLRLTLWTYKKNRTTKTSIL